MTCVCFPGQNAFVDVYIACTPLGHPTAVTVASMESEGKRKEKESEGKQVQAGIRTLLNLFYIP